LHACHNDQVKGLDLAKYEGVGNDFLVLIDDGSVAVPDGELTRALCHRHLGIGADGLLVIAKGPGKSEITMHLSNADGSFAETSGNGLRCAVLAARHHGLVSGDEMLVTTVAGSSLARITEWSGPSAQIRVEMGVAAVVQAPSSPIEGITAYAVDVGNPHLVLLGVSFPGIDLARVGPAWSGALAGGQNIELITPGPSPGSLSLVVYERGVGITDSCGTGSCAGAAVARAIGEVGDIVSVHNPGGVLVVELEGAAFSPNAALSGPARRIATCRIDLADFAETLDARLNVSSSSDEHGVST
jgi:diaminopimelate epimerase